MRIKFIIPFPFDEEGVANRAAQIPRDLLGPETDVECVPVRNSATLVDSQYEALVFLAHIDVEPPPSRLTAVHAPAAIN